MEATMDRMKGNEDFSMKNINKVNGKLQNQGSIIEGHRSKVSIQRDKVEGWVKQLALQSDKNKEKIADGRQYNTTTSALMDEKIGNAIFVQDAANEDFIEYRDSANERVDGAENIINQTAEEFVDAREQQRDRGDKMTAHTTGLGTFFDALVADHNHSKNELPQTVMERQDLMDVIAYEQTGARSSVDSYMQELKEAKTAEKIRQHEVDYKRLTDFYNDGDKTAKEMDVKASQCSSELATQVEVMDNFPKSIGVLDTKMATARKMIKALSDRVEKLLADCGATISDVHNLYSIKDDVETMLQTIENREQRVKRVRAELSAIEQSTIDNGNLLQEAFKEIKKQNQQASDLLEEVRKHVMGALQQKQDAMDSVVSKIQKELDDLTGEDAAPETGPEQVKSAQVVTAAEASNNAAEDDGSLSSRQAVLDQRTFAHAGDMARIFESYFKDCEKNNQIKPLNKKDAEKTTILSIAVGELMASSIDIDVVLKVASTDLGGPADSIPVLRAARMDQFIRDMQDQARINGDFTPLGHEALNKYSTLLRRVLQMNMNKHEHILVDDELTPEQRASMPRCLACDRPIASNVTDPDARDTVIVRRGHFPSFGDTTRDQGSHLTASVDGGDYNPYPNAGKRRPKGGRLASLGSQSSVASGAGGGTGSQMDYLAAREEERYKLVAGFRMKQSQSMSSIGHGSQLR